MIFIRVDTNEEIATGHLMRCMTIAKEMCRQGMQVAFITADYNSDELLKRNNFSAICLNTVWNDMEEEIPKLLSVIEKNRDGRDCLVVDSYMVTREYIHSLSKVIKIVYFDDLFSDQYDVDILINYNLYHILFPYRKAYESKKTKLLLGGRYVPLREQFRLAGEANMKFSHEIQVLLICGGGDRYRILPDVIKKIRTSDSEWLKSLVLNVVIGTYNYELEEIIKQKEEYGNINVYINVENMAELMQRSDFAISAASTVLYELCAMKVPTIFFCMADNQEYDKKAFEEGLMNYAGDIRLERREVLDRIEMGLIELLQNPLKKNQMMERMSDVVDLCGTERIVKEIKQICY